MIIKDSSWRIKQNTSYPKLTGQIEADVVIIGGGLAGIFNAYVLSSAGLKVVVLEQNEVLFQRATMHTTASVTKVTDTPFAELIDIYGPEKAKLAWKAGQEAVDLITEIIKKEKIECEFKSVPCITYARNEKEFANLSKEFEAIKNAGFEATLSEDSGKLNFKNEGFLEIPGQVNFHPIKFAETLAAKAESYGAKIFTNSQVLTVEGTTVKTKEGSVSAKDVITATYRPLTQEGTRFKKVMYMSYVFEIEIAKGLIKEGMYLDMNNPYHYFRVDSYKNFDRMIVGGEDHREDVKMDPEKNFRALEKYLKNLLGNNPYKITRKWPGLILESSDGLALIGERKPHNFVITGFSGNGMSYSAISSMITRDMIAKNKNPYVDLYDPKRTASFKQIATKATDFIGEFFGGAFKNFFS